jgi:excisionase family DNA binding protein
METKKITITMKEIAEMLGVGRKTAVKLIGTPGFPEPFVVGTKKMFIKADFEKWLTEQTGTESIMEEGKKEAVNNAMERAYNGLCLRALQSALDFGKFEMVEGVLGQLRRKRNQLASDTDELETMWVDSTGADGAVDENELCRMMVKYLED